MIALCFFYLSVVLVYQFSTSMTYLMPTLQIECVFECLKPLLHTFYSKTEYKNKNQYVFCLVCTMWWWVFCEPNFGVLYPHPLLNARRKLCFLNIGCAMWTFFFNKNHVVNLVVLSCCHSFLIWNQCYIGCFTEYLIVLQ